MHLTSVPFDLNNKLTSKSFRYSAYLTRLIGHKLSGRFWRTATITPSQLTTICSPLWFIKTDTSCSLLSTVNDSIPKMIRTESIKRSDHLFTFLFSKTYLDKNIHLTATNNLSGWFRFFIIDSMSFCQDVNSINTSTHNTCFHIVYPSPFNTN